jgi:epoxyqueuosine reductase
LPDLNQITASIKEMSASLGFVDCGITQAIYLEKYSDYLKKWLDAKNQAGMAYMERNLDKRLNPSLIIDDARSVIVVLASYKPLILQKSEVYKVAKYAFGADYHSVMKEKLYTLLDFIKQLLLNVNGRAFVDSAPLLERALAVQAGLGWIGKNCCLISKKWGSFVFIGELVIDAELKYDEHYTSSYCGSCSKCLEACPTQALEMAHCLNSNKCISYHTIENRGSLPSGFQFDFQHYIFGCDRCQDVCPWNRSKGNYMYDNDFTGVPAFLEWEASDWETLSEKRFNEVFNKTAFERCGFEKLMRNIGYVKDSNALL